ncbi:MAG TPA: hypothetical protein VKT20_08560 [Candidatus Dormibacteraeota bacterium]|nr:hypothetical protein [Candidatus Dormibacteraeota bacterium]
MRRWLRKPLFWMVLAEMCVLAVLFGFTLHVLAGARHDAVGPLTLPEASAPTDTSVPDVPSDALSPPQSTAPPLLPGLNVDPAFWRDRLIGLNAAEAQVEALEWRIVHSALDTVERYVNTVVVPAVERAEGKGA